MGVAPAGWGMQRVRDVARLMCGTTRPDTCYAVVERGHRFDEVLGPLSYETEFTYPITGIEIENFHDTVTSTRYNGGLLIDFDTDTECVQTTDGRITCRKRTPEYV